MANHGANKNKRKYVQAPAEDRYNSLEVHKQLACYRYYTHLELYCTRKVQAFPIFEIRNSRTLPPPTVSK